MQEQRLVKAQKIEMVDGMKRLVKILLGVFGGIAVLILVVFIAFQVSPKPSAMLIARMFNGEVSITDQESYDLAQEKVSVSKDETYPSAFSKNDYDVYVPKNLTAPAPVLVWLHGGGYVGGDKAGVKEFAVKLASDEQMIVVAMNYEVAPASQYPNQVIQVGELFQALQQKADPDLDLARVFLGGDSAGAQIALQYTNTQTNVTYGQKMGLAKLLDKGSIKGVISYCGPVDLKQIADSSVEDKNMRFFLETVAWSLTGTKEVSNNPKLQEASLVDQVTADFPPTYLTDGNAYSFQEEGMALEERLQALNVPVRSLFYADVSKEITHEYQFDYTMDEAKKCYQETLDFLNEFKEK